MLINSYNPSDRDKLIYYHTIMDNPYIPEEIKPYPKQAIGILLASQEEIDNKPNSVLLGGSGFSGKTTMGSVLAVQYLQEPDYTALIMRKNYSELLDASSIWENLQTWACGDHLPENIRCKSVKSPTPKIIAPSGATLYFKAFDRPELKHKLKSASYERIISDESSELDPEILKFQYRSIRTKSRIPRSVIFLSNPGGPATDYLIQEFISGEKYFVEMGFKDNIYIDQEAYEQSLKELDYVDQQYQRFGNWFYKPSQGDLINRDEMESQKVKSNDVPIQYSLMGIDMAGKGKDKFAIVRYDLLANGLEKIVDFDQTVSENPEEMLYRFVAKHNPDPYPLTSLIVIEQEGGSASLYAQRYFQEILEDFRIPVVLKSPKGSKFQRARPLMHKIRNGQVKLNEEANYIDDFIDESVQLSPDGKGRSPNLVDSTTLIHNYLHQEITLKQTKIKKGVKIGA